MRFNHPLIREFYGKYNIFDGKTVKGSLTYDDLIIIANLTIEGLIKYKEDLRKEYLKFKELKNGKSVLSEMHYLSTVQTLDNILKCGLCFKINLNSYIYKSTDDEKSLLLKILKIEVERKRVEVKGFEVNGFEKNGAEVRKVEEKINGRNGKYFRRERDIKLLEEFIEDIEDSMQNRIGIFRKRQLNLY